MPKRLSSERFNPFTRWHIIPRLNAQTGSSVDIAGSSRGLSANLSSLVQTTGANVDMQVDREEGSSFVVSSQKMSRRRSIALSGLNGLLGEVMEIRSMLLDAIIFDPRDERFLWCISAIQNYQERPGRSSSPRHLVTWAINELRAHLHLSGIVAGSSEDIGQAPSHPNDPHRIHYQRILASIEKVDRQ